MVPVDSSAAKIPRPGATMASATLFNSATFIVLSRKKFTPDWSRILSATYDSLSPEGGGWGEGVRTSEQKLGLPNPLILSFSPLGRRDAARRHERHLQPLRLYRPRFGSFVDFILCACGCGSLADQQHFHTRQGLAFERFQKGAARGRDMAQAAQAPGDVGPREGAAAACKPDKLFRFREFRHRFRHSDGSGVERFHLEGAERAVPDQGFGAGQHRDHLFDAARADV